MTEQNHQDPPKEVINIFGRTFPMPQSRLARVGVGIAFVIGGILGFLPVLGFWMIPLGLLILSRDIAPLRRFRRKVVARFKRWHLERNGGQK